jgi:septal ring factor EnvC (AmiA/AmiB activator)
MNHRKILFLFVTLIMGTFQSSMPAGEGDDVRSKQKELQRLRNEIEAYEERIKDKEEKETSTLDLLDSYDKQTVLLRKLIAQLAEGEIKFQNDIEETRRSMQHLNSQLGYIKRQYSRYVTTLYKNGRMYDMELLFTSRSLNQALIRSEYLKRFSEQRKKDVGRIFEKRDDAEEQRLLLQRQLAEQRELIASKRSEENKLRERTGKRKKLLTELRRDKKLLRQEVERTKQAANDLENLITQLIAEEEKKKEREAALAKTSPKPSENVPITPSLRFDDKRGRMRWPVSGGKIVARFGNQKHPVLKTVTQNTGIDISVPSGTNVEAVAKGIVSRISWLPSFGNLVILDHSRGYRTVYAHLSEISIAEGQTLEEGNVLGKSGESLSGQLLHFEIWRDRVKQDPELWLAPKGLTRR